MLVIDHAFCLVALADPAGWLMFPDAQSAQEKE